MMRFPKRIFAVFVLKNRKKNPAKVSGRAFSAISTLAFGFFCGFKGSRGSPGLGGAPRRKINSLIVNWPPAAEGGAGARLPRNPICAPQPHSPVRWG